MNPLVEPWLAARGVGRAGALAYRRFVHRDELAGWRLLSGIARRLTPSYPLDEFGIDYLSDERFVEYLDRFHEGATGASTGARRRWFLWQLLKLSSNVPGDTVECGVYLGASSWLMAASNRGTSKVHHVFDSFEGLSAPGPGDGHHWRRGVLAVEEERTSRNLGAFGSSVRLYKGWIPTRFREVADRQFSFVHLDVDLERPTEDSLKFFYPRLEPGGVLLCDDYGYATCPGATAAIDRFFLDRPEVPIVGSSGGAFIVRGVEGRALRLPVDALPARS